MSKHITAAILAGLLLSNGSATAQEPNFGRALVLSGDELFVGQPVNWYGPGVVYAYALDRSGEWLEQARLIASDSARMDDFGRALAADGNTLIVGAPRKRDGSGVAYAFERASADADWRQVAIIESPAAGDHSEYATSLALSGDDLLVGSPAVDSTGVVYHYRRADGAWRLHATIRPSGDAPGAGFGYTMSLADEWLAIGAPAADSGAGRVYFSRKQPNGEWGEATAVSLPRSEAARRARAGSAVVIAGDRAYVGAPGASAVFALSLDPTGVWMPSASCVRSTSRAGRSSATRSRPRARRSGWERRA